VSYLIPQLIDYQVERQPDRPAIHFLDQQLSYAQLMHASNRLGNCLVEYGVGRGDRVGIYMNKCLELAVALYGIMKAGAAYVPLDPLAPAERIAEIVEDCDIRVIVSADDRKTRLLQLADLLEAPLVVLGATPADDFPLAAESWERILQHYSVALPPVNILESDLAYIIYTSGSTGRPKGIMHTHHSGLSFARWAAREYALVPPDRLSNHAPLHFDLSIFDFFAAAVAGASTAMVPEEYTKFPASYSQFLADFKISVLFTVPFALVQLLLRGALEERDLGSLRWVIYGGEPFPLKYLRQLMDVLPWAGFDNMYGPAEVNGCSHHRITGVAEGDTAIPIGRICQIAEALVVDEHLHPVAAGESGELLVRTPTMMQGYWGRPDLNDKAFYYRQVHGDYQHRFYRTGDLVQMDPDGVLWFLGRKDRQVKVRGYRIELDEIEAVLVAHGDVEQAAVYPVRDGDESTEIQGAVTLKPERETTAGELISYLKNRLAPYAVPTRLSLLGEFPRTSTGKIDRRSLSRGLPA
jgi:amino acid adenylation domain-containing protein